MKISLAALLLLTCLVPCSLYSAEHSSPASRQQTLRFASGTQSYPFSVKKEGDVLGIYQELLVLAAEGSGYSIQVGSYPAGRLIAALKNAEIDIFPYFEIGEFIKFKDVPDTVICDQVLFSVKMSLFSLASVDKVEDEAIIRKVGWMRYHYIPSEQFAEYISFDVSFLYAHSYPQLIKMLMANRIDYAISAVPNFYANYEKLGGKAVVKEDNIFPSAAVKLGFSTLALGDKAEAISQQFCEQVERMVSDGRVDEVLAKYSKLKYFNKP